MEQSLSSLAFKGSIAEAIAEAKRQKKLFVVYTSGDNQDSKILETSTWVNPNVSESLSKYCILLHILEGSSEASNFSAIYPQHSVPCITVIGYNGVQLWQKGGFVGADVLASSLEKAWLSLHVQETTVAFLTAALASGTSKTAPSEQAAPGTSGSVPLTDDNIISSGAGQPLHSKTIEDRSFHEDGSEEAEDGVAFPEPSSTNLLDSGELDESIPDTDSGNSSQTPVVIGEDNLEVAGLVTEEKNLDICANKLSSNNEVSQEIVNESVEAANINNEYPKEVEKAATSGSSAIKSNDVFLNIRLPDGSSLQVKFSVMDTLKMVEDYISENQTGSLSSFSIAIPYPRKIFNDQDLNSTLSELGLFNRQALVVVPNNQNSSHDRGGSLNYQNSSDGAGASNGNEGYWAFIRRVFSYVNPLSYLNRSPSSSGDAQESHGGIWQYSPNPSLQNTLRHGGRPSPNQSSDQWMAARASGGNTKSRQQTPGFGGNIHTLKHDDSDDSRFQDRNAFWNGNSTQYGGNDDEK